VVVGPPTDEYMDVRIVRVPKVDGGSIELGAEIAFGVGCEVRGEGSQAFLFDGIPGVAR
jgi:hypothetical protein